MFPLPFGVQWAVFRHRVFPSGCDKEVSELPDHLFFLTRSSLDQQKTGRRHPNGGCEHFFFFSFTRNPDQAKMWIRNAKQLFKYLISTNFGRRKNSDRSIFPPLTVTGSVIASVGVYPISLSASPLAQHGPLSFPNALTAQSVFPFSGGHSRWPLNFLPSRAPQAGVVTFLTRNDSAIPRRGGSRFLSSF